MKIAACLEQPFDAPFSAAPYGIFRASMVPKFLLALLSCALTLLVGELGVRAIWGPPAWTDLRVVFFSTHTWQRDPMGAMRYTPSATVRTVAIYGDRVEYDARFRVNNLGFIDRIDYQTEVEAETETENPKSQRIAFVGDSFTARVGHLV